MYIISTLTEGLRLPVNRGLEEDVDFVIEGLETLTGGAERGSVELVDTAEGVDEPPSPPAAEFGCGAKPRIQSS